MSIEDQTRIKNDEISKGTSEIESLTATAAAAAADRCTSRSNNGVRGVQTLDCVHHQLCWAYVEAAIEQNEATIKTLTARIAEVE
eukprot:1467811-Amphidinium_carterae.1